MDESTGGKLTSRNTRLVPAVWMLSIIGIMFSWMIQKSDLFYCWCFYILDYFKYYYLYMNISRLSDSSKLRISPHQQLINLFLKELNHLEIDVFIIKTNKQIKIFSLIILSNRNIFLLIEVLQWVCSNEWYPALNVSPITSRYHC